MNKGAVLPFHHQRIIYNLLRAEADDHGISFDQITFSGLKGQTRICKEGLRYTSKNVTLVLSSIHRTLLETLTFSLFDRDEVQLAGLRLQPEWVEAEANPSFQSTAQYLCISPLIPYPEKEIAESGTVLKIPFDVAFEQLIRQSLTQRMYQEGNFNMKEIEAAQSVEFIPDRNYLDRLSERGKKFARDYTVERTDKGSIECKGYTFPFSLTAPSFIHNYIFHTGLGTFPEHGFGMIDLADQKLQRKQLFHRNDILEGRVINPLKQKALAQTG